MRKTIFAASFMAMSALTLAACSSNEPVASADNSANMAAHSSHMMAPEDRAELMTHVNQDWEREYVELMDKMHTDMMAGLFTDNADVAFVLSMIPHHQGAIDMAELVLKYGKDPEVKKLAENIITAQTSEIAWMNSFLKEQGVDPKALPETETNAAWKSQFLRSMMPMHDRMNNALVYDYDDADIGFVVGMIPHHQGAIDMAYFVQRFGQNEEVKKLASNIISAQNKEIAWMTQYLVDHKVKMPR